MFKFLHAFGLMIRDKFKNRKDKSFNRYGLRMYTGKQGAGKSTAMTEYLWRLRQQYPNALIYSNYGLAFEDGPMEGWQDLLEKRNGTDGVIFAIDEIHSEFSTDSWRNFPPELLREITQQRKQRIHIVASSQVFSRVAIQLRESTYEVVECRTWLGGRLTLTRLFDAEDYNDWLAGSRTQDNKFKLPRKERLVFVQTDSLRNKFDTYKKIEKMRKVEFLKQEDKQLK